MFRIASNQFGYLMYASLSEPGWSDQIEDAIVYSQMDSRDIKLPFWRGVAKADGLDPDCVQIVEA